MRRRCWRALVLVAAQLAERASAARPRCREDDILVRNNQGRHTAVDLTGCTSVNINGFPDVTSDNIFFAHFCEAVAAAGPELREVDISFRRTKPPRGNPINDKGIALLADAVMGTNVERLHIGGNVCEADADAAASLRRLAMKLEYFDSINIGVIRRGERPLDLANAPSVSECDAVVLGAILHSEETDIKDINLGKYSLDPTTMNAMGLGELVSKFQGGIPSAFVGDAEGDGTKKTVRASSSRINIEKHAPTHTSHEEL